MWYTLTPVNTHTVMYVLVSELTLCEIVLYQQNILQRNVVLSIVFVDPSAHLQILNNKEESH